MLDDLRNSAASSYEDESPYEEEEIRPRRERGGSFLGMTPPQRFVIALMLLLMTCVLGTFFLVATEKIVLPVF